MTDTAAFEAARMAYEAPAMWGKPPSVRLHAAIEAYLSALPLGKDEPVAWRGRRGDYPLGTKAFAIGGGHWTRVTRGWKWHMGDTFPTPGPDAFDVEIPAVSPPSEREVIEALTINNFASELSSAMDARCATVRGLEATIGVDKSAVSRARRGKAVSQAHFIALFNWLHGPAAGGK